MRVGLVANEEKIKYMMSATKGSDSHQTGSTISVDSYNFEAVKDFLYLGRNVNSTNDNTVEIRQRTLLANRLFYGLKNQLSSKLLSWISSILLYGAETCKG